MQKQKKESSPGGGKKSMKNTLQRSTFIGHIPHRVKKRDILNGEGGLWSCLQQKSKNGGKK